MPCCQVRRANAVVMETASLMWMDMEHVSQLRRKAIFFKMATRSCTTFGKLRFSFLHNARKYMNALANVNAGARYTGIPHMRQGIVKCIIQQTGLCAKASLLQVKG